jgi:hypothetical protein
MNILAVSLIVLGILLIGAFNASFLAFDKLVQYEYNSYKAQWETDGKPRGYFWSPREDWHSQIAKGVSAWKARAASTSAFQKLILTWMFSTPQWTKKEETATRLLKQFRLWAFIGNGALILGFLLLATNAIRQG